MLNAGHSLFPYYVWLYDAARRGRFSACELLRHFDSPKVIYLQGAAALARLAFLSPRAREALCEKDLSHAAAVAAACAEHDIFLLCPDHEDYPDALRLLSSPPLLYGMGSLFPPRQIALAIVGTRHSAKAANRCAYRLGYTLGKCGAVIVSGLALGIDGMAHLGALDGGAFTVAVLGCGLDCCYPRQHRTLFEQIKKRGLLLSPFPPGTPPLPRNFPARNRIISGLCAATVVVQAPQQSGAVVTAQDALSQGRLLYAFPGAIDDPGYSGNLSLLRSGARLITCAEDLMDDLSQGGPSPFFRGRMELDDFYDHFSPFPSPCDPEPGQKSPSEQAPLSPLPRKEAPRVDAPRDGAPHIPSSSPKSTAQPLCPAKGAPQTPADAAQRILCALGTHGATPEQLCETLSLPLSEIELLLLQLELDGLVRVSAGERYLPV